MKHLDKNGKTIHDKDIVIIHIPNSLDPIYKKYYNYLHGTVAIVNGRGLGRPTIEAISEDSKRTEKRFLLNTWLEVVGNIRMES